MGTTEINEACIQACNACADACDRCVSDCLKEEDVKSMTDCITLDIDCAAICRLSAGYMARRSSSAGKLCEFCAGVCEACAAACGKHPVDHCQACAEACRRCAHACRTMAVPA